MKPWWTTALVVMLGTGCARHPDRLAASDIDPERFSHMDCERLRKEIIYNDALVEDRYEELKSTANWDKVQTAVGMIVPPAFILLDGPGNGIDEQGYADLKGESMALREQAHRKGCDISDIPVPKGLDTPS